MKKLFFCSLALLAAFYCLSQSVMIDSDEYNLLKLEGTLGETELIHPSSHSTPANIYPARGGDVTESCDCWIEPDDTYTLSNFGASGVDDGSTDNIAFPFDFNLYGNLYSSFWINANGNITFDNANLGFTSTGFPSNDIMLAPFWADADFGCSGGNCGEMYYKITENAVYVNWVEVGYFGGTSNQTNSFQVIFTEDDSGTFDDDSNVQFCYKNMQWTTGSASGGNGGFGGASATIGANAGNSIDYMSFGGFDQSGISYNGPASTSNGVNWLDDRGLTFNVGFDIDENVPPVLVSDNCIDTLVICNEQNITLNFDFLDVNQNQNISILLDDGGYSDYSQSTDQVTGYTQLSLVINSSANYGLYNFSVSATDDGVPAATQSIEFVIHILDQDGAELSISSPTLEGGIAYYCPSSAGALVTAEGDLGEIEWSTGSEALTEQFTQGVYSLTGESVNSCAASSFQFTVLEYYAETPDIDQEDYSVCPEGNTSITFENPEDFQSFSWTTFFGAFLTDPNNAAVQVEAGVYSLETTDSNGCLNFTPVSVSENVLNVPPLNFGTVCNDDEVFWAGAFAEPEECTYFIYLYDSEGDSWEGASISVFVDGVGPYPFNIANNAIFLPTGIEVSHGQVIEYYFNPGLDDDDISIVLYDQNNDVVFDSEFDFLFPGDFFPFFTQIANCGFNELSGQWSAESDDPNVSITFDHTDNFNPVNGLNSATLNDPVDSEVTLIFESDLCDQTYDFPVVFSFPDAGDITIGPNEVETITIITGDGMPDVFDMNTTSASENNITYLLITEDGLIKAIFDSSYDFGGLSEGTYTIIAVNQTTDLPFQPGDEYNSFFLDFCSSVSNEVEVIVIPFMISVDELSNWEGSIFMDGETLVYSGLEVGNTMDLYDSSGKLVHSSIIPNSSGNISLAGFSQGIYIGRLLYSEQVITFKALKND